MFHWTPLHSAPCPLSSFVPAVNCDTGVASISWNNSSPDVEYTVSAVDAVGHRYNCSGTDSGCDLDTLQCGTEYSVTITPSRDGCVGRDSPKEMIMTGEDGDGCVPVHWKSRFIYLFIALTVWLIHKSYILRTIISVSHYFKSPVCLTCRTLRSTAWQTLRGRYLTTRLKPGTTLSWWLTVRIMSRHSSATPHQTGLVPCHRWHAARTSLLLWRPKTSSAPVKPVTESPLKLVSTTKYSETSYISIKLFLILLSS